MRLSLQGLGHAFPPAPDLFSDVSFDFEPGALVALTGPSGSGKSTLLTILAGWVTPLRGHVIRDGIQTTTWVPQNPFGVAARSVLDHAALPLIARGSGRAEANQQAMAVLEKFNLAHTSTRRFSHLSGGEAQRLMLAQACLGTAELMLVDEPTASLDMSSAASVISVLEQLADDGRIVVIATHDPRVVSACPTALPLGAA